MNKFIEYYSEFKYSKPPTLRDNVRQLVLDVLSVANFRNENLLKKNRVQLLYIHHTFKDEEHSLRKLIESLAKNHQFISHTQAVDKIMNNSISQPYISFSSDDGFKNNFVAAKIFHDYGIKACFFINPQLIGETNFEIIKKHNSERLHFPPTEYLNWNDIEQLQKWGHEIGAHTLNHFNVAAQTPEVFLKDCQKTYQIIQEKCGKTSPIHFAFPYGRFTDFNEIARKYVFETGFASCASAERGCHTNSIKSIDYNRLCLRRDHVVLNWKFKHLFYFLIQNAKKANEYNNFFPY